MITEAIDFRYLLIENYKKLKISENELATIFVIDHLIGQGNPFVTTDLLSLKMTLDIKEIDNVLTVITPLKFRITGVKDKLHDRFIILLGKKKKMVYLHQ